MKRVGEATCPFFEYGHRVHVGDMLCFKMSRFLKLLMYWPYQKFIIGRVVHP